MFEVAFDRRDPSRILCADYGGEVFRSLDGGGRWEKMPPLPAGGRQVYALAVG